LSSADTQQGTDFSFIGKRTFYYEDKEALQAILLESKKGAMA